MDGFPDGYGTGDGHAEAQAPSAMAEAKAPMADQKVFESIVKRMSFPGPLSIQGLNRWACIKQLIGRISRSIVNGLVEGLSPDG